MVLFPHVFHRECRSRLKLYGFIYLMSLDNQYLLDFYVIPPLSYSPQYSYLMQTFHNFLSARCSSGWPWCTRSSCNNCFSDLCSSCTGFSLSDCKGCLSGATVISRGMRTSRLQLQCRRPFQLHWLFSASLTLVGGLCVNFPYGYSGSISPGPVLDITFSTFSQTYGGMFTSG